MGEPEGGKKAAEVPKARRRCTEAIPRVGPMLKEVYSYSSSSQRTLQIWQVNQPGIQCPRSETVCSEPQRRHLGFGVISRFFTSTSGIQKHSLIRGFTMITLLQTIPSDNGILT